MGKVLAICISEKKGTLKNEINKQLASQLVWALSCSLAATWEIDFSFSSCSYLDVCWICFIAAMNSDQVSGRLSGSSPA